MAGELTRKFQLKPGMTVLVVNPPAHYAELLRTDFTAGEVHLLDERPGGKGHFDVVQLFVRDSGELASFYNSARAALRPDSQLWIAYPKQSSKTPTDLNRDSLHERIVADGWQGVRQVALDAIWSALRFKRAAVATDDARVAQQYSGAKAHLRPIYNRVLEIVEGLGPDVQVHPRQSYVAFGRRNHFAAVAPATRERVDLALKLPERPFDDFVQPNNGVGGGALTHMVSLTSTMDVDDRVQALLLAAYAAAAA